jgi:sulfur carrier protein ThiS
MNSIQVYDPPMCCSTGTCGTEINPNLVNFAALLAQLVARGVKVARFNLGQQPMAFAQNPTVRALLEKQGPDALPLILLNGEVYLQGRYPTAAERPVLFGAAFRPSEIMAP